MGIIDLITGKDRKRAEEERRQLEIARQKSLQRAAQSPNPVVAQKAQTKVQNNAWRVQAPPQPTLKQNFEDATGTVGKTLFNFGKGVVEAPVALGRGVGNTLATYSVDYRRAQESEQMLRDIENQTNGTMFKLLKNGTPEQQQRAANYLNKSQPAKTGMNDLRTQIASENDPKRLAAAGASLALDLATLGVAGASKQGIKTAYQGAKAAQVANNANKARQVTSGVIAGTKRYGIDTAKTAAMGGASGGLSAYINDPNATAKQALSGVGMGAALGGALPTAFIGASYAPTVVKGIQNADLGAKALQAGRVLRDIGKPTGQALQNLQTAKANVDTQITGLLQKRSIAQTRKPDLVPILDRQIDDLYSQSDSLTRKMNTRGQGGYIDFGAMKETADAIKYRAEIKKRLQAEADYFKVNKKELMDKDISRNMWVGKNSVNEKGNYAGKNYNSATSQNEKMFKEFEKNPDAFIDKYNLMPPQFSKTAKPSQEVPNPAYKAPQVGKTDIGKEIYTNYNGKKGTIVGEKDGYILVKPDDSNIRTDLYTKDQWDRITTKQNEYIADAKRVEARKIEATKQETLNQQKQADIKKRREAIVDYTGTTPMQRGRIDKMLSKEVSVWGKTGTLDEVIAAHNPRGKIQYRDGTYGLVLDDNSKVFNIPKTIWDRMNLDEISRNAFGEEKLVRKAIKNSPSVDTNLPKAVSNNSIPQTRENRIIPRVGDTPLPLKKEVIIGDTTPLKKGNTRPDPLTTVSGRKIQLDQYNPKGRDPSAKWNATLIDAAIEEAKLRNDSMNLGIFEDMKGTSYKNISQSDLSGIHQYLFDSPDSIKLTYGNKPTPAQVGKTDPTYYHGSSNPEIKEFNVNRSKGGIKVDALGTGVYLTPDKNIAKKYGDNIYSIGVGKDTKIVELGTKTNWADSNQLLNLKNSLNKRGIDADIGADGVTLTTKHGVIDANNPDTLLSAIQEARRGWDGGNIEKAFDDAGINGLMNAKTNEVVVFDPRKAKITPPQSTPVAQVGKTPFAKTLEDVGIKKAKEAPAPIKTTEQNDKVLNNLQTQLRKAERAASKETQEVADYIDMYADALRQMESTAKGGQLLKVDDGTSGGSYVRTTEHSNFYRKYYSENGKPPTKQAWRDEAKRQLNNGTGDEYAVAEYKALTGNQEADRIRKAIEDRQNELSLYPQNVKPVKGQPNKMTNAEWQSLQETAPFNATTKKQAIGQELAAVRKELEASKKLATQMSERQKINVITGKENVASKMRETNAKMFEDIKNLQKRERELAKQYAMESPADNRVNMSDPKNVTLDGINEAFNSSLKDKSKKKMFEQLSKDYLGDVEAAKITADKRALDFTNKHQLNDVEKLDVIKATDDPTVKGLTPKVKEAVDELHRTYDELYNYFTKEKGVDMGYQHDYYPREYVNVKTGDQMTAAEYNLLQKASARTKGRSSDALADWKLKYTDPADGLKSYYSNLEKAAAGRKYMQELENQGLVVKGDGAPMSGYRPIIAEGIQPSGGGVYYAKKEVADKLNTMFGSQEATNMLGKALEKGEGLNSFWQSVVLSGGVPNTPLNAFGFMQVMKEGMALHPIKAGKALWGGVNKNFAQQYFERKSPVMAMMAKEGISTRYSLSEGAKKGLGRTKDAFKDSKAQGINQAWNELTNDATFGRFMPLLMTEHFDKIYKHGLKKGLSPEQASKIAGNSTKNFYGITDLYNTTTRSKYVSDAAGTFLFAPRFRESMLNFWVKNAKLADPRGGFKNLRSPEYRDNAKFMAAAALTYAAYDMANYEMNGTHLWQNPDGKKDKLLIPNATSDGKTVGIPFLPSIGTVPRNAGMFVYNTLTGNFGEAGKNLTSFASMPIKTAGEVLTNQNYFGQPIVDEKADPLTRLTQGGSYIAKSTLQPWVREGLNVVGSKLPEPVQEALGTKQKSAFETASNALEAPLRFYDPKYMRGGGDNFKTASGKTNGEIKSQKTTKLSLEDAQAIQKKEYGGKYANMNKDEIAELAKTDKEAAAYQKSWEATTAAYGKTPDLPSNLPDSAKKIFTTESRLTKEGKEKWNKRVTTDKTVTDNLSKWLPNKVELPPITNSVAKEWAEYEKKRADGTLGKLEAEDEKTTILRNAFNSSLNEDEKDLYKLSKTKLLDAYDRGVINDDNVNRALAVEKQMYDAGLLDTMTLHKKLGLAYSSKTEKSGGRTSRKSGSSRSSTAKKQFTIPDGFTFAPNKSAVSSVAKLLASSKIDYRK